jgi:hypothetical protein
VSAEKYLRPNPNLPKGLPADIAKMFGEFAQMLTFLDDRVKIGGIEQWELMYQKLLEAKDCAVRAVLDL